MARTAAFTSTRAAPNGMVVSVDHLASEAGVIMLRAGGSAADAAVAAAAVLAVTAPHLCGMGGDLFALVHSPGAGPGSVPSALNASGRAGSGADAERLRHEGRSAMPFAGDLRAAPVPGCVDGWLALHARFGRLPIHAVLAPAASYAADGFPVSPLLAAMAPGLWGVAGAEEMWETPLHEGRMLRRPGVADALRDIADGGRAGFYHGVFGAGLLGMGAGEYTPDDLREPLADWVEPLSVRVWGHDLWTIPPNSQGYLTLLGAAIAEGLPLPADPTQAEWAHLLVESARVAAYDRPQVLHEHADVRPLLTPEAVARRRARIDPDRRACLRAPVGAGDTTALCVIDSERMAVSLIQSNASGFGCHIFEPATGIGLHNRGIGFSLRPGHPAEYGPRRRPPHTLAPALVTVAGGRLRGVLATMGGDAQPQILLQALARWLHHGSPPGRVIGAPRFALTGSAHSGFDTWSDPDGARVEVESRAASWVDGLRVRGHEVKVVPGVTGTFGHAHLIELRDDVVYGAADPRALVGAAAGY